MKNLPYSLLFCFILLAVNVAANTRISSQSGNWSASSTWGGNPAPGAGDDVIIDGGFIVTVDITNASCLSLQVGGSAQGQGSGTLDFNSGSQVTISGGLNIGPVNDKTTPGSLNMASGGTLICESISVNRLGTWNAGTGTIELSATNTISSDNNVNFNNLVITGGTTTLSRNITVGGNLTINSGALLVSGNNTMTISGNWTTNGSFSGAGGTVIFNKNGNQFISGTGQNNFNLIKQDMGIGTTNILEVTATIFNAPSPFLTIVNGTFKMSGNFSFSNSFFAGPAYNIDPTAGFWINNPNITVTGQAANISVRGLLRLTAGTYNVGTATDESLNYVTGSSILIEGGTLNIAGRLTRNNSTQTTTYTQTGGTVNVVMQGSTDAVFAGFDLGVVGSVFNMSGGSIVVRNATSAPSDFLNASSVANVTGGTLQLGDASTLNAQTIRVQSTKPVGNLLVSSATAQAVKPVGKLLSSLNVVNNVIIQTGAALNANGLNITLGGDWADNGTFTNGNTITFNGTGAQLITRQAGETFNNLIVNKTAGILSLNNALAVNSNFNLTQGTLAVGSNTLTLNNSVIGGGTLTSAVNGTVLYNQPSDGQQVLAAGYGHLSFSNFNKILPAIGVIGITGIFSPGTAIAHTITGSSIDFNGGSQPVPAFTYNNLTASGSGTKTGSGIINATGDFTNNTGIIFSGGLMLHLTGTKHINNGKLSTDSLVIGPLALFTNNDSLTVNKYLSGDGSLMQGTNAFLTLGGIASLAVLNAGALGNTVTYNGAGQTVLPSVYHHLILSGSATKGLSGVTVINGNFTMAGTALTTATAPMNIAGEFRLNPGTVFHTGAFAIHIGK